MVELKLELKGTNLVIVAMLAVAALGTAFWILAISPKRDEASKLGAEVKQLKASLAEHQAQVSQAEEAREQFPTDYQKLVVLGKAVPGDDDTASLLVQVNRIAKRAGGSFREIQLSPGSGGTAEAPAASSGTAAGGEPVSATEAAASLLPLGASIGPAGLAVMPYTLTLRGNFFEVADFIKGLDSMVATQQEKVAVDGRLLTIDGFSLEGDSKAGFPTLKASFSITTYVTPPSSGPTGEATPEGPGSQTATPAATTVGAVR